MALITQVYGIKISIKSSENITFKRISFVASILIMLRSRDLQTLLQPHNSNLILLISLATVFFPAFITYPTDVPSVSIMLHMVFIALFQQ